MRKNVRTAVLLHQAHEGNGESHDDEEDGDDDQDVDVQVVQAVHAEDGDDDDGVLSVIHHVVPVDVLKAIRGPVEHVQGAAVRNHVGVPAEERHRNDVEWGPDAAGA